MSSYDSSPDREKCALFLRAILPRYAYLGEDPGVGDANLYRYAYDDPETLTDPAGLYATDTDPARCTGNQSGSAAAAFSQTTGTLVWSSNGKELSGSPVAPLPKSLGISFVTTEYLEPSSAASLYQDFINDKNFQVKADQTWDQVNSSFSEFSGTTKWSSVILSAHGASASVTNSKLSIDLGDLVDDQGKIKDTPQVRFLRKIGGSMTGSAELEIRACKVGSGEAGDKFLSAVAKIINHRVRGYTDWYAIGPHGQERIADPYQPITDGKLYPPYKGSKVQRKNDGFPFKAGQ
jgi:hypothetical protein